MTDRLQTIVVGGFGLLGGIVILREVIHRSQIRGIPVVGPSWTPSALSFLASVPRTVQLGYERYPTGVFRIARPFDWLFVACGNQRVKELANAPNDVLSSSAGGEEALQSRYTMGPEINDNPYHVHVVLTGLTRNLHARLPDVRTEVIAAFDEIIQLQDSEWKSISVMPTSMQIIARVSNMLFIGLPLCRNKEFLQNSVQYTMNVVGVAGKINRYPEFLWPVVGPLLARSMRNRGLDKALELLGPIVAERLAKEDELGVNYAGRPNDLISWFMDEATPDERNVRSLVLRILVVNMAAIHTTSNAFVHAIYKLAAHPEHLLPMREEVERLGVSRDSTDGWTKSALGGMTKIDSFLRETQRMNGTGVVGMKRRVVSRSGFRFSDGTFLPYGSVVCVAARSAQYDSGELYYTSADSIPAYYTELIY
ncbi:cytochrome P450 [Mycena amicta]|nr:cytochrome P450 [Mycena amicta]